MSLKFSVFLQQQLHAREPPPPIPDISKLYPPKSRAQTLQQSILHAAQTHDYPTDVPDFGSDFTRLVLVRCFVVCFVFVVTHKQKKITPGGEKVALWKYVLGVLNAAGFLKPS